MDEVRLGIIGMGGMGSYHAAYLLRGEVSNCRLTAVCDINPAKLENYKHLKCFVNSEELIRSGEVDAVLIATPHYSHTTIGIDAFKNNLHVLTEKPISVHKADCERLINAWNPEKQVFSAMFQLRADGMFKKLKQLIDSGELGEIFRISWIVTNWFRTQAYYSSGDWRATWEGEGGGVLLNQCPHNLDLMQWLFGMPAKIRAFCGFGVKHDIEVEDRVTAYLEYPNGATGIFVTTTCEAPGTDRLEIAAEQGLVVVEDKCIKYYRNEIPMTEFSHTTDQRFAAPPKWNVEIPYTKSGADHKKITQNFVNAILFGEERITPGEEGIKSIELATSMLYSTWTDSTVVLPLDSAAYENKLNELRKNSRYIKKNVVSANNNDLGDSFK